MDCPVCMASNPNNATICTSCGASLISSGIAPSPLNLPPSTLLKQGKYRIIKTLGEGGFGITYKAIDVNTSLEVAIKELLPDRSSKKGMTFIWSSSVTPQEKRKQLQEFRSEAESLSKCSHPNIVKVFDQFEENDTAYIAMEFARGEPLSSVLRREKTLPESRVRSYLLQLADALKAIHTNGLLHRDIKPDNIILNQQDKPILIDFGNARGFSGKTQKMTVALTPVYAPPEQNNSLGRFAATVDIYSLSATVYELLTGQLPALGMDRLMALALSKPDPLIPPNKIATISPLMEQIVLTGMKINAGERFQSAQDLINALTPTARLVFNKQGVPTVEFALKSTNVIGKFDPDMSPVDINLEKFSGSDTISRKHAEIYLEGNQWKIKDIGSTNGVFIKRLGQTRFSAKITTPETLVTGDEIAFGAVKFIFQN
jgi:serine/threonine protein kinase